MINITATDIINYLPVIEEYVDFSRNNNYFDKYINKCLKTLTRLLKVENIDITTNDYDNNENLKELLLSYIVYSIYLENSYRVEEDRYFIEELDEQYDFNFNLFVKEQKQTTLEISTSFLG